MISKFLYYLKFNKQQREALDIASSEYGLTKEQIKKYADPNFTCGQLDQIFLGVCHGLTDEQIKVYTSTFRANYELKHFSPLQMEQIRLGFEQGLNVKQVEKYAMDYLPKQMEQIRLGFVHGLTDEQVNLYRSYLYTSIQMKTIRTKLEEGVTIEDIKKMIERA